MNIWEKIYWWLHRKYHRAPEGALTPKEFKAAMGIEKAKDN